MGLLILTTIIHAALVYIVKGVAIISVTETGFVFSVSSGDGVLMKHNDDDTWGPPSALEFGGSSAGAIFGKGKKQIFIFPMNEYGLSLLTSNTRYQLGVEIGLAMGPHGGEAEAGATAGGRGLGSTLTYTFAKGALLDVGCNNCFVENKDSINSAFYGYYVAATDIVMKAGAVDAPEGSGVEDLQSKLSGLTEKKGVHEEAKQVGNEDAKQVDDQDAKQVDDQGVDKDAKQVGNQDAKQVEDQGMDKDAKPVESHDLDGVDAKQVESQDDSQGESKKEKKHHKKHRKKQDVDQDAKQVDDQDVHQDAKQDVDRDVKQVEDQSVDNDSEQVGDQDGSQDKTKEEKKHRKKHHKKHRKKHYNLEQEQKAIDADADKAFEDLEKKLG